MTVVTLFSMKGAPGVTTLACLLGAAWRTPGPMAVVEADPAGGDLAARFGLSVHTGWSSLASATRRSGEGEWSDSHVQELPGGLPVLVGARGDERCRADSPEGRVVRAGPGGSRREPGTSQGTTIVDLGRFTLGDGLSESWLACSDAALLVVRGDAAGAVRLRDRCDRLAEVCACRIGVVAVGAGYTSHEIAEFADVMAVADIPLDAAAADVVCGGSGSGRRLDRSLLWMSTVRMATTVADQIGRRSGPVTTDGAPHTAIGGPETVADPTGHGIRPGTEGAGARYGPLGRALGRSGQEGPSWRNRPRRRGPSDRSAVDVVEAGA